MPDRNGTQPFKILFVYGSPGDQLSSFVAQDLMLLKEFCQVEELSLAAFSSKLRGPLASAAIWRAVLRNDMVFGWFAECTPVILIARLVGRPSVLVGGGSDVVQMPEIGYGLVRLKNWQVRLATLGFALASKVLLFSESSKLSLLDLPGMRSENLETLYLGVDTDWFRPGQEKLPQALTIGYVTKVNLRRKGLATFAEAAQRTPDIRYLLAGKVQDQQALATLQAMAPANLSLLGYLPPPALLEQYQRARVYAQLSLHEGFGLALAEAMACECVPIVTDRGAIPEVVGDTGVFVPAEDAATTSDAIRQVIVGSRKDLMGRRAKERITQLFPIAARRAGLRRVIEMLARESHR